MNMKDKEAILASYKLKWWLITLRLAHQPKKTIKSKIFPVPKSMAEHRRDKYRNTGKK